jgi:hypothetical protein
MTQDKIGLGNIEADGYYKPSDGGGGEFRTVAYSSEPDNGGSYPGTIFSTGINGKAFRQRED